MFKKRKGAYVLSSPVRRVIREVIGRNCHGGSRSKRSKELEGRSEHQPHEKDDIGPTDRNEERRELSIPRHALVMCTYRLRCRLSVRSFPNSVVPKRDGQRSSGNSNQPQAVTPPLFVCVLSPSLRFRLVPDFREVVICGVTRNDARARSNRYWKVCDRKEQPPSQSSPTSNSEPSHARYWPAMTTAILVIVPAEQISETPTLSHAMDNKLHRYLPTKGVTSSMLFGLE